MGVSVIRPRLQVGIGPFSNKSNAGYLCLKGDQKAPKIHELVPGSSSSGKRCNAASMGQDKLCLSSRANDPEGVAEDGERKDQDGDDLAKVAVSVVVATRPESVGGSDPTPAKLQVCPDDGGQVPDPPLHGPLGGGAHPVKSNLNFTSDPVLNDFLAQSLSKGTQKGYNSSYSKFVAYCSSKNMQPESCSPEDIAKYLHFLFQSGSRYSSINLARSAISKFHVGFNGTPAGQHKIVCNAVKAVFRLRPPLPKYKETYDVTIVLDYLKSLPPNSQLSLKQLSYKTLFLLTVATISRVSSVAQLGPDLSINKVNVSVIN